MYPGLFIKAQVLVMGQALDVSSRLVEGHSD